MQTGYDEVARTWNGMQTRAEEDSVLRVTCHQLLSSPISHLSNEPRFEKCGKFLPIGKLAGLIITMEI